MASNFTSPKAACTYVLLLLASGSASAQPPSTPLVLLTCPVRIALCCNCARALLHEASLQDRALCAMIMHCAGIESKSAASTSASSSKADTPQVGGLRGLGGLMDGGEPDSSHMSLGGSMSMDHAAFVVPAAGAAADAPVVGSCVIQEVTSLDSAASAPVALIGDNKGSFGRMFGFSRA